MSKLATAHDITSTIELNNGVRMPWLGLGVFKVNEGGEVEEAVKSAIRTGYRSIDTAAGYNNELGVGLAIKESKVPRRELFITTKLANPSNGYENALKAFEESRMKLGLEYIDLYLIHWPVKGKYKESWKALEKLYKEGLVRAIGVSNFQVHHLQDLMGASDIIPAINQVEYHPCLTQLELHDFCKSNGIQLEAWSPLMQGNLLNNLTIVELGQKYNKSTSQIILRWDLQNGVITIPKSVKEHRIQENAAIFDFELSIEDMTKINLMNLNKRIGPDPDNFDF